MLPTPGMGVVEPLRLFLCHLDQIIHAVDRKRGVDPDAGAHKHLHRNRNEILGDVIFRALHMRGDRDRTVRRRQQHIAVGRGSDDGFEREFAAAAHTAFDDNRFAQTLGNSRTDGASDQIGRAPRCNRQEDSNGFVGIGLRVCGRQPQQCANGYGTESANPPHEWPSPFVAALLSMSLPFVSITIQEHRRRSQCIASCDSRSRTIASAILTGGS